MKTKKNIQSMCQAKKEKHIDLLLIREEGERLFSYQGFDSFMCDHTLQRGRKHFYRCWLQAFSSEEISKCHMKDCFKINGKWIIAMPKRCIR